MNSLSDEASVHVRGGKFSYKSSKQSRSAIVIATMFFLCFSISFLQGLCSHLYYISSFFFTLQVDSRWLWLILVPSASSRSLWRMVIWLEKYCSEVTSSLMQPGNYPQSIQNCGSSFPLGIFGFLFFLNIYGARPYQQSFFESLFDYKDLYPIYVQLIRGDIPPRTQTSHTLGQRPTLMTKAQNPIV